MLTVINLVNLGLRWLAGKPAFVAAARTRSSEAPLRNTILDRKTLEFIFAITLFLSAALLFGVEPMFAKMILPRLGGSAAVWSVAIAFFQTTLFLGYLYAHILTRYFSFVTAAAVHFGVLAIALLSLPIAVSPAFHEPRPAGRISG
jgi:hypothetical protein